VKVTIVVTDVIYRFRVAAICPEAVPVQMWQMEVMTLVEVGRILHFLGFITANDAYRLGQASTTVVPLDGFKTMPLADLVPVLELALPEDEELAQISDEAKEGYMMVVTGETTDEMLAAVGFVLMVDGPMQ
jgi:hypothetical protein